ncbi:TRAP-type C4-dicarboxylate transport system, small permease component [Desulfuromusa kysingii]|uniref:TRAP-type C4-dicarboxylate transport system, small permease component n=1 Tax=Desulfuromusa kysingii TaxID=37625 RepID=A0A1H3YD49_9BACT|nr:TRAP transporter small permease [Desulfuromusa kysingii]SEA08852.1 TRAP-type C4-dicarboxylate transport system, small permease component [Desulfuromusa kysingii]
MRIILKIDALAVKVQNLLLTKLFILMILVMLTQVFCRYFLEMPLAWSEEVSRYMFIVVSYLGATIALAESSHIEINVTHVIFEKYIKSKDKIIKVELILDTIKCFITLMITMLITYYCSIYAFEDYKFEQVSTALGFPLYFISGFIFISMVLMSFHSLVQFIGNINEMKAPKSA